MVPITSTGRMWYAFHVSCLIFSTRCEPTEFYSTKPSPRSPLTRRNSVNTCHLFTRLRHPKDPSAHTALGYFLLSEHSVGSDDLETLDRATSAFRRARNASRGDVFVPATRGLAVALRKRLSKTFEGGPHTSKEDVINDSRRDQKVRKGFHVSDTSDRSRSRSSR